jgi:hypothetical protein
VCRQPASWSVAGEKGIDSGGCGLRDSKQWELGRRRIPGWRRLGSRERRAMTAGTWASPGPPCSCNPAAAGRSYRDLGSQRGSRRSGLAAQVLLAGGSAGGGRGGARRLVLWSLRRQGQRRCTGSYFLLFHRRRSTGAEDFVCRGMFCQINR